MAGKEPNTPEVLWSKVDVKSPDECWPWLGHVSESGYGRVWIDSWAYYAHRVIFDLANPGQIERKAPTNKKAKGFLMHLCDNRICCNPAHLKVADLTENNRDAHAKGRVHHKKGGEHHRSVFTDQQIELALQLRKEGYSSTQIAEKLNFKRSTIKSLFYRNRIDASPRLVTSDEDIAKIVQMRQDGCTQITIAETMQMNLSTVKSILQRRGV